MKKMIWLAVLCLCLGLLGQAGAEVTDCSASAKDFGRGMAMLTQSAPMTVDEDGLVPKSWSPQLVLCRTDGSDLELPDAVYAVEGPGSRYAVLCTSNADAADMVAQLRQQDGVLWAEQDADVYAMDYTEEAESISFMSPALKNLNMHYYLAMTRHYGRGTVRVAVIDSGCSAHSYYRSRLVLGGHDYVDDDDDSTNDGVGHGTHVAGIIADGTAGTQTNIMPFRVLNDEGKGKMSYVTCAVLEAKEAGVDIINLSLGSSVMSEALDDALMTAVNAGCIVVAASGNNGVNTSGICPAHLNVSGIIVVGSAEASGTDTVRAAYSNYGASVDVYAYGSSVISCWLNNQYARKSGTSMAAGQITGICALMRHIWPGIGPSTVEKRLVAISKGTAPVPDAYQLLPRTMGASLTDVRLGVGDTIQLWTQAEPITACMSITWTVDDTTVATAENGLLTGVAPGTTTVTATCTGMEAMTFRLTVTSESTISVAPSVDLLSAEMLRGTALQQLLLPSTITTLGDYALADCPQLSQVRVPNTVTSFGTGVFSGSASAVLLCEDSSPAHVYAETNSLQYILSPISHE